MKMSLMEKVADGRQKSSPKYHTFNKKQVCSHNFEVLLCLHLSPTNKNNTTQLEIGDLLKCKTNNLS